MAICNITSFLNNCETTCAGGLKRFWIISAKQLDIEAALASANTNGEITSLPTLLSGVFSEWEFEQDTLNLNSTAVFNGCKGTYTHTVAGTIQCVTLDNEKKRAEFLACLCCGAVVIFETNTGERFILGLVSGRPVKNVTKFDAVIEATLDGKNGYDIEIQWVSIEALARLESSVVVPV